MDGAQVPQEPPHPSEPQFTPAHEGVQPSLVQVPAPLQVVPPGQVPQEPPHPSLPQLFPPQSAVHETSQRPASPQAVPSGQSPQVPPHPLGPQTLPSHSGVQQKGSRTFWQWPSPEQESTVHGSASAQSMGWPPTQAPLEQMVFFEQASPSSQGVPVMVAVKMQVPVAALQADSKHGPGGVWLAQSSLITQALGWLSAPSVAGSPSPAGPTSSGTPVSTVGNAGMSPAAPDADGESELQPPTRQRAAPARREIRAEFVPVRWIWVILVMENLMARP